MVTYAGDPDGSHWYEDYLPADGSSPEVYGLVPPTLASPANGSVQYSSDVSLQWNSVTGAAWYQVQVSTSSAFTSTVVDANVSSTSYTASGLSNGVYYWRVRAGAGSDISQWSDVWNFTVSVSATPTIIIDGSFSDWDAVSPATFNDPYTVGEGDEANADTESPMDFDEVDMKLVQVWNNSTHIAFRISTLSGGTSYKEINLIMDTRSGGTRGNDNDAPWGSWDNSFYADWWITLPMDAGAWYTAADSNYGVHEWNGTAWVNNTVATGDLQKAFDSFQENFEFMIPLADMGLNGNETIKLVVVMGGDSAGTWIEDYVPSSDSPALVYDLSTGEGSAGTGSEEISSGGTSSGSENVEVPAEVVVVAPNPVSISSGRVTFKSLGDGAVVVEIYNIVGVKVSEVSVSSGVAVWNLKNIVGERVAPGVYLVVVRDASGGIIKKSTMVITAQ